MEISKSLENLLWQLFQYWVPPKCVLRFHFDHLVAVMSLTEIIQLLKMSVSEIISDTDPSGLVWSKRLRQRGYLVMLVNGTCFPCCCPREISVANILKPRAHLIFEKEKKKKERKLPARSKPGQGFWLLVCELSTILKPTASTVNKKSMETM